MATQSAWGTTIGDLGGKSWAEDAIEEEDVHGQIAAPEIVKPAPKADNEEFPSLGQASGPRGKKGKKKMTKMNLAEFNSTTASSFNAMDEKARMLQSLPKHAGESSGYMGHGGGMHSRGRFEAEPSKADGSSDWGADRRSGPPPRAGGAFGGGGGGGGSGGGGFGGSRADEEGAWGRGGGVGGGMGGGMAPRRNGFGGSGMPRSDTEDTWSRGTALQRNSPRGGAVGGFGTSRADDENTWSRGTAVVQPMASPGARGAGFGLSRADEESKWSRGTMLSQGVQPREDGPGPGGPSRADAVSSWARDPHAQQAPSVLGSFAQRELPAADSNDDWGRSKGKLAPSSAGHSVNSPRSDRGSPRTFTRRADEAKSWVSTKPSATPAASTASPAAPTGPVRKPHPSEGRWGKQEAPAQQAQPPGAEKAEAAPPAKENEDSEPSQEEIELQAKLAALQLQVEAGDGDADSKDVGPDGAMMTILDAADACEADLQAAEAARRTKATETAADAQGTWKKVMPPQSDSTNVVSPSQNTDDADDNDGFSEVVNRATAKRAAKLSGQPPSKNGASQGGAKNGPWHTPNKGEKVPAHSAPKKGGGAW